MNMSPKYIVSFTLLIAAMIGWNAFLVVRDNNLFESYANQKEKVCAHLNTWHPDCKVE